MRLLISFSFWRSLSLFTWVFSLHCHFPVLRSCPWVVSELSLSRGNCSLASAVQLFEGTSPSATNQTFDGKNLPWYCLCGYRHNKRYFIAFQVGTVFRPKRIKSSLWKLFSVAGLGLIWTGRTFLSVLLRSWRSSQRTLNRRGHSKVT